MPTQCNPEQFDFARADGRAVVASFAGGAITSNAGALLLGATDRVLGLTPSPGGLFPGQPPSRLHRARGRDAGDAADCRHCAGL
jgi:hypothetical protein